MYFVTTLVSINGLRLYLIMHNYALSNLATPTKCFDKNLKKKSTKFYTVHAPQIAKILARTLI